MEKLTNEVVKYWIQSDLSGIYDKVYFKAEENAIQIYEESLIGGAQWKTAGSHFVSLWAECDDATKKQMLTVFLLQTLSGLCRNTSFIVGEISY
jgi:hypothetical protein